MTDRVWRKRGLRDAVAAGDTHAWRAWYEAEYAPLETYVLWRCGSLRDLADDVLQETWMTAVRRVRRFDPAAGPFLGGFAASRRMCCGITCEAGDGGRIGNSRCRGCGSRRWGNC